MMVEGIGPCPRCGKPRFWKTIQEGYQDAIHEWVKHTHKLYDAECGGALAVEQAVVEDIDEEVLHVVRSLGERVAEEKRLDQDVNWMRQVFKEARVSLQRVKTAWCSTLGKHDKCERVEICECYCHEKARAVING